IKPADKNKLQTLNDRELGALTETQLKAILPILKENQVKTLEKMDKLTDATKEQLRTDWEEKAEEAPLQKALKRVNELQQNNAGIANIVREYKANGSHIDTAASQKIKALLQLDHNEKKEEHEATAREFKNRLQAKKQAEKEHMDAAQEYESNRTPENELVMNTKLAAMNAAKADHEQARAAMASSMVRSQQSQDILKKYDEFEENRKNIAPNKEVNDDGEKG